MITVEPGDDRWEGSSQNTSETSAFEKLGIDIELMLARLAVGLMRQEDSRQHGTSRPVSHLDEYLQQGWNQLYALCLGLDIKPPRHLPDLVHWLHLPLEEWPIPLPSTGAPLEGALLSYGIPTETCRELDREMGGSIHPERELADLSNERLDAWLHLRDQRGLHMVNASLKDALRLAHREQSRISVSEAILAQRAVSLVDYGATEAEQLAEISRRAKQDPDSLRPPAREPLNLDFSTGLRGWHFFRDSAHGSYELDPHTTLTGRTSLAITLHQPFTHGSSGILYYGGSLTERYRGQRVRLSAYVKTEQMHQPSLAFHLSWPTDKISPLTGRAASASCLTHSHIVPHVGESSWARHEMVINVPPQTRHFSFELGTNEQGKLWLDGIELATVDQNVALTGTLLRPPSSQPLNLDFSEGLEYWEREGGSLRHYEIAVDTTASPCATLKSIVETPAGSCILQQKLNPENYQGKRVRLTAHLKTRDVSSRASLFIGSFPGAEEDHVEHVITGTTSWIPFTLDWQVPAEDRGVIVFGASLQGPGQIWLQDVYLQTVEGS